MKNWIDGDSVRVTYAGRTVDAVIMIASSNGRSLGLEFEAILGGHAGHAGGMAVFRHDERSLSRRHQSSTRHHRDRLTMNVYGRLEEAGHDLTLAAGIRAGVSTYYCEHCGALVLLRDHDVLLFHAPMFSTATESECIAKGLPDPRAAARKIRRVVGGDTELPSLKKRLDNLEAEEWRRRASEDD
jgi:hypothetical protein